MEPRCAVPVLYLFAGCVFLGTTAFVASAQNATTVPVNVGVVMDLDSLLGKIWLSCIDMSLSDFYAARPYYNTRIVLHTRDSGNDVVGAAAAALDLIKNKKVQAIMGPKTSMEANFVIELGQKAQVPVVTFSASSPALAALRSPYFFRLAQTDSAQVAAISALVKHFGWRQVVPIYQDDEFGDGILPFLIDGLQNVNARVPYRSVIDPAANSDQIGIELYKLMTMQTRVFVVHMFPPLADRLFAKAKEIGMMTEEYVWILTDATTISLDSMSSSVLHSMQGALGVKTYVPESSELNSFRIRWQQKFLRENLKSNDPKLDVFGLWAYDSAWALAVAVERIGATDFTFQNPNQSDNLTDLQTLGVSKNGEKIRASLSMTHFKGLAGEFSIVNGQLQSPNFEIVNVNNNGGNRVAFYGSTKNSSLSEIRPIIWPGYTTKTPKGWEMPTNGTRLRIGVPVKEGYSEFVKVTGNELGATGYCPDVFNAAMAALPYAVSFEYVPFALPNGSSAGSYDDLIMKVNQGIFDGAVGDITIVANRSQYVDFTMPFTESGVSMVVPIISNSKNKAWTFLKPLTLNLWITSLCFFIFMGFVVWILEHRINEDFRGPPSHQIGTSLWYSFGTMVFAQRETLVSNLARFVVVIWFFVVLILTQSYTASLTSLLTVQQLQPTITDISQLLKTQPWVGYQDGSFVFELLKSEGIKNLKRYDSPDQLHELFELGSSNGGIDAAFDEIPYVKLFISKFADKYTTSDANYKTDGFGFAFPIGSPLVADLSRSVLNVTESELMNQIQKKWLGDQWNAPASGAKFTSSRLGLSSFWGLFLIAGSSAVIALLTYFSIFVYKEKHRLLGANEEDATSVWNKIRVLLRIYDGKDLTSHTFKKSPRPQTSRFDDKSPVINMSSVEASPSNIYPPSPSNDSVYDAGFEFFSESSADSSPRNQVASVEMVEIVVHSTMETEEEAEAAPQNQDQEVALGHGEEK